jgi:hypothetical protein
VYVTSRGVVFAVVLDAAVTIDYQL